MPKYKYTCECGNSVVKYAPRDKLTLRCKKCKSEMKRELPVLNGPSQKRELVDPVVNTRHIDNQDEIIKARSQKYYWGVEVPKMVNSGKYSIETMIEKGWVWFDDNMQMHIYTKPPHER